ncbi:hypothetical protein RF031_19395, partial [Acinetobacter baumannii]|nr:hypothetical protein [Acinetobacter baumannii]
NAKRDKAEYAWIPSGDTCPFCLTLASQGWQDARRDIQKDHLHAHCDCTYAVRFTKTGGVAGYDPDRYKEIYDDADGRTSKDK